MKKQRSIMAIPAFENKADNPYNYILNSGLLEAGVRVSGYSFRKLLAASSFDLLHLHWPENFLYARSAAGAWKAFFVFWSKVLYLKLRGKKLVWTVHNLAPHESNFPQVIHLFYRLLYRYMDGFISLTRHGAAELEKRGVAAHRITVVPHPHYRGYYPNDHTREAARQQLGLPSNGFVFLFIGQVRRYKNVVGLVRAFRELNDQNAHLVIAGKVHPDVADELSAALTGATNIRLFPQFIRNEDLQLYLNSADLVVTPFQKVLNSGSVFLNLSFGKPTLVPATESLLELQAEVGEDWLKTFSGSLTATDLRRCLQERSGRSLPAAPDLSSFSWTAVAEKTSAFYERVCRPGKVASSENPDIQLRSV